MRRVLLLLLALYIAWPGGCRRVCPEMEKGCHPYPPRELYR
jgi:hypothetical protein